MPLTGETTLTQDQHSDVVEALEEINAAIRKIKATADAPIVNVTVEPSAVEIPPASIVVESSKPVKYKFTIYRGDHGFIKSVLAEPV